MVCDDVGGTTEGTSAGAATVASVPAAAPVAVTGGVAPEQVAGDRRQQRGLAVGAAEQRAVEERRRGVGDAAVAHRMAKRSAARASLEERERKGR